MIRILFAFTLTEWDANGKRNPCKARHLSLKRAFGYDEPAFSHRVFSIGHHFTAFTPFLASKDVSCQLCLFCYRP